MRWVGYRSTRRQATPPVAPAEPARERLAGAAACGLEGRAVASLDAACNSAVPSAGAYPMNPPDTRTASFEPPAVDPPLAVDRRDFFGGEVRRQHDLQHLDVVTVPELTMADARRLVHAGSGFEADASLPFVLELDPALEHVDELELGAMQVGLAGELGARGGADHVRGDAPLRRLLDAEIAVLEEGAKAAL